MTAPVQQNPSELLALLAQQAWRASPAATAVRWSHGQWRRTRHLSYLSTILADGIAHGGLRLIVSLPPRHGKSWLTSVWTPLWCLANWPRRHVILVSYEATFASSWGRKARDLALVENGLGVYVRDDVQAIEHWETLGGGGMTTAGIGGPITGRGADLLLIDDPVKNSEEAASPTIRESHWDWWQTTARTRLEPGGSAIVVMTRWDVDDLAGRLQRDGTGQWQVVSLPAVAERDDPLGRALDDPLWPERYDATALHRTRQDVGEDVWASMYQQHPNPAGRGLYFDVEACNDLLRGAALPILEARGGGLVRTWQRPIVGHRYVAGADLAWGEKGAYSCLPVADYATMNQVAELYGRPGLDETALEAVKLLREYQGAYVDVEANGEGLQVVNKMVELGYGERMYHHGENWRQEERDRGGLTTAANRPVLLAELQSLVMARAIRPTCEDTAKEMLSFVRDEKGRPGPRPGAYADHVMAWARLVNARKYANYGLAGRRPIKMAAMW